MTILAKNICIGDQLAESDGFLWTVTDVSSIDDEFVEVRLNSDFSSNREHWIGEKGKMLKLELNQYYLGLKMNEG